MSSSSESFSGTVGITPADSPDVWIKTADPQIRFNSNTDIRLTNPLLSASSGTFDIPTNLDNPFISPTLWNSFQTFGNVISSVNTISNYTLSQSTLTVNFNQPLLSLDTTSTPVVNVKLGKRAIDTAMNVYYTYISTITRKGYIVNPTSITGTLINSIYLPTNISSSRSFTIGTSLPTTILPTNKGAYSFSTLYTAGDLVCYPTIDGSIFMCLSGPEYRGSNYDGISSIQPVNPPGASMYWSLVENRGFSTWTFNPTSDLLLEPAYYPNASTIYWLNASEPAPNPGLLLPSTLLQGFQLFGSTILQDTFINSFQYGTAYTALTYGFNVSANTVISTLETPVYVRRGLPPFEAALASAQSDFNAGLNASGFETDASTGRIVVKASLLPSLVSSYSTFYTATTRITPSTVSIYSPVDRYILGNLVSFPNLADSTYMCKTPYTTIQNKTPADLPTPPGDEITWITENGTVALDSQTLAFAGAETGVDRMVLSKTSFTGAVRMTFTLTSGASVKGGFVLSDKTTFAASATMNGSTITFSSGDSASATAGDIVTIYYDGSNTIQCAVNGVTQSTPITFDGSSPLTPAFLLSSPDASVIHVRVYNIPFTQAIGSSGDYTYISSVLSRLNISGSPVPLVTFSTMTSSRTLGIPSLLSGVPSLPADEGDYAIDIQFQNLYTYNASAWKYTGHLAFHPSAMSYIGSSIPSSAAFGDFLIHPSANTLSRYIHIDASISSFATLSTPSGYFVDSTGVGYTLTSRAIQRIATDGSMSTLKFNGSGSNVSTLSYITPGSNGFAYVTDTGLNRISKVTLASGFISTVSISTATTAFVKPAGLTVGSNETLYIADSGDHTIRMLSSATMTTFAGISGVSSFINGIRVPPNPDLDPSPPPPGSAFSQFGELKAYFDAVNYSGSGKWQDESGYGRHASCMMGAIIRNTAQNAIVFTGNQFWRFPNPGSMSNWTTEFWFKQTASMAGNRCIVTEDTAGRFLNMVIGGTIFSGSNLGSAIYTDGAWKEGVNLPPITWHTWYNIGFTWDGTTMRGYINGSNVVTNGSVGTYSMSASPGNNYTIGGQWSDPEYQNKLIGELGSLRILNRALSATEMNEIYLRSASNYLNLSTVYTGPELPTPLLHLEATPYSGSGTWTDASPNGFNATLLEGTAAKNSDGNGIFLDGTTAWTLPNIGAGSNWTVSAWYKATAEPPIAGPYSTQYPQACIIKQGFARNESLDVGVVSMALGYLNNGYNMYAYYVNDNGSAATVTPTGYTLPINTWTHITASYDGTTLKQYINGSLHSSQESSTPSLDSGQPYYIGTNNGQYLVGVLGELRVYPSALSAATISSLYTYLAPNYPNPLVLLRAVNYTGEGAWVDESGNGYNATLEAGTAQMNASGTGILLDGSTTWTFPDVNAGSTWSLAIWYKHTDPPTTTPAQILTQGIASNHANMRIGYTTSTAVTGGFYSGGAYKSSYPITPIKNCWNHIVVTYDGSILKTYLNSLLISRTSETSGTSSSGQVYRIGQYIRGEVRDIRIYPNAIPDTLVEALYATTYAVYTTPPILATFNTPTNLVLDTSGNLFVSDTGNHAIRKLPLAANIVTTFAGTGSSGSADGSGSSASFNQPLGIASDSSRAIYVADFGGNTIRKITASGTVSTLTSATAPTVLTVDASGSLSWLENGGTILMKSIPESTSVQTILNLSTEGASLIEWEPSTDLVSVKTSMLYQLSDTSTTAYMAYSNTRFYKPCSLQFKAGQQSAYVAAYLTVNPLRLFDYTYYGIVLESDNTISVVGFGLSTVSFGTSWTTSTVFKISIQGSTVTFSKDGTPFYTTPAVVSSFYQCIFQTKTKGSVINAIQFLPISSATPSLWHPMKALDFSTAIALAPAANASDTQKGTNWFVSAANSELYALGNTVLHGYEVWGPDIGFARITSYYFNTTSPSGQDSQSIYITLDKSIQSTFVRGTHYILRAKPVVSSLMRDTTSGHIVYKPSVLPSSLVTYTPIPLAGRNVTPRNRGVYSSSTEYLAGDLVYYPTLTDTLYFCAAPYTTIKGVTPTSNSAIWSPLLNLLDAIQLNPSYHASDIQSGPNWFVSAPSEHIYKMGTGALNGYQIWGPDFGYATIVNYFFNYTSPSNQDPHSIYITLNKDISSTFTRGPHYILGVPALPPLVLLQAINYKGSGQWLDESGHGRHATIENGTIAKNAEGNGILLDGSTNWTFPDVNAGNNWTASVWFKETDTPTGTYAQILSQNYNTNINLSIGHYDSLSEIVGEFCTNGPISDIMTSPGYVLPRNIWKHITLTYNSSNLLFYINGIESGSRSVSTESVSSGLSYSIGSVAWATDEYVIGEIGEVRIYNRAFTPTEVTTLYGITSAGYPIPDTPGIPG